MKILDNVEYSDDLSTLIKLTKDFDKDKLIVNPNCTFIAQNACESAKIKSVELNNVRTIGEEAFYKSSIEGITFPNKCQINRQAFYNCNKLSKIIFNNQSSIAASAFFKCENLKSIDLKGINFISGYAFIKCSLESLEIPESVEFIGQNAFKSNKIENDLIIPDNVKFIGYGAFGYNHIKKAIIKGAPELGSNIFNFDIEEIIISPECSDKNPNFIKEYSDKIKITNLDYLITQNTFKQANEILKDYKQCR